MTENLSPASFDNLPRPYLCLDGTWYGLLQALTGGATSVVWQAFACEQPAEPHHAIENNPHGWQWLLDLAETAIPPHWPNPHSGGRLVAIKLARPGMLDALSAELWPLRRLDGLGITPRLIWPFAAEPPADWSSFPAVVMAWAEGTQLNQMVPLPEGKGLAILLAAARKLEAAQSVLSDLAPTDGIKQDTLFVKNDDEVQWIDWNVYSRELGDYYSKSLPRFGELLVYTFAPGMGFTIDRASNTWDMNRLAAGLAAGDPGLNEWDALSFGTRRLAWRILSGELGRAGDARAAIRSLREALAEARARWLDEDPLLQSSVATSSVERLAWLDSAAARGKSLRADLKLSLERLPLEVANQLASQEHPDHAQALYYLHCAIRRVRRTEQPLGLALRLAYLLQRAALSTGEAEAYRRWNLSNLPLEAETRKEQQLEEAVLALRKLERQYNARPEVSQPLALAWNYLACLRMAEAGLEQLRFNLDVDAAADLLQQAGKTIELIGEMEGSFGLPALPMLDERVSALQKALDDAAAQGIKPLEPTVKELEQRSLFEPWLAAAQAQQKALQEQYDERMKQLEQDYKDRIKDLIKIPEQQFTQLVKTALARLENPNPENLQITLAEFDEARVRFPLLWSQCNDSTHVLGLQDQPLETIRRQTRARLIDDLLRQAQQASEAQLPQAQEWLARLLELQPGNAQAILCQRDALALQHALACYHAENYTEAEEAFRMASANAFANLKVEDQPWQTARAAAPLLRQLKELDQAQAYHNLVDDQLGWLARFFMIQHRLSDTPPGAPARKLVSVTRTHAQANLTAVGEHLSLINDRWKALPLTDNEGTTRIYKEITSLLETIDSHDLINSATQAGINVALLAQTLNSARQFAVACRQMEPLQG